MIGLLDVLGRSAWPVDLDEDDREGDVGEAIDPHARIGLLPEQDQRQEDIAVVNGRRIAVRVKFIALPPGQTARGRRTDVAR